jgi:hypothetical protein
MQFHAGNITVFVLPIGTYPHFASGDTFDGTILVEEDLGGGEPRIHFDA